jgi:hypothetical protein
MVSLCVIIPPVFTGGYQHGSLSGLPAIGTTELLVSGLVRE